MLKKIELKVGLFVVITSVLILTFVVYIAYSKGFFSKEHAFTLSSNSGEDLAEGMPVYFSGFKIGRIEKLELNDKGMVMVKIRVPDQHVKWIRLSSKFSINKPLIGAAKLIVTSTDFNSPALSNKDITEIVRVDDINETIKRVQPTLEKIDKVVANIERITANLANPQGDINKILSNAEKLSANFAKKESLVEMVVGKPESVQSIHRSIKKAEDILAKVDAIVAKTDEQVYGNDGVLPSVRKILKDLISKLENLNKVVDNFVNVSSDAAASTRDLKLLRTELDSTVDSIGKAVNDLDRIIHFKKQPEIKLP